MTTAHSAPGKIYLFDEHAVVHAAEAIASAINLHTTATVAESNQTDVVNNNGKRNDRSKINAQTPPRNWRISPKKSGTLLRASQSGGNSWKQKH